MGLPYSKEIHAAFDQVTPLVAAGFEVLQTTKDIAILLAVIQVVTAITLVLILLALLGLLFSINEDLATERAHLVTPVMKWLASWVYKYGRIANWIIKISFTVGMVIAGWSIWQAMATGHNEPKLDEEQSEESKEDAPKDAEKDKKDAKDGKKEKCPMGIY